MIAKPISIKHTGGKSDGCASKVVELTSDRFVQQAVLQVLQKRWDPTFSEHSHGFRPGHSARQAVREAQQYIAEGHVFGVRPLFGSRPRGAL
jgi:retron-type reverse transcriptase